MVDIIPLKYEISYLGAALSSKGTPPFGLPEQNTQDNYARSDKIKSEESLNNKTGSGGTNLSNNDLYPESRKRGKVILVGLIIFGLLVATGIIFYVWQSAKSEQSSEQSTREQVNAGFKDADDDLDGLSTEMEMQLGTNPNIADTDADGMPDGFEKKWSLSPLDDNDANWDQDEDGLSNFDEWQYGTDPNNPDSDSDGFLDGEEVKRGYNPLGEGRL